MEKKGVILINKYVIGKLLGQGNFAKVYHARNLQTGQNVAIKVIDKRKILQVNLTDQIKREISVMRLCQHPNVVKLYEVMASKSKIYLAVEYVRGGELFDLVAKGRLRESAARKYFQQLIGAVDYCHSMGVCHRDLKPENILLDESGNLKVTDFGLSALSESRAEDGLLHTSCGTPAYVAPEVIRKKGYDGGKTDIWSCGVILFVLLAGYLPFNDPNLMNMYGKIARADFKCPQWFPRDVKMLLKRLLDPNPRTRMTVSELMENHWFRVGFKRYHGESPRSVIDFEKEWDECVVEHTPEGEPNAMTMKPTSLNAFGIISRSSSFDLSGLFEEDTNPENGTRFTIPKPASTIVSKLEMALMDRYKIKAKDGIVRIQSFKEGRRGQLAICAEIFEITPSLHVVEVMQSGGDANEYKQFCDQELRPSLIDME